MFKWGQLLLGMPRSGMLPRERMHKERREWDVSLMEERYLYKRVVRRIRDKPEYLVTLNSTEGRLWREEYAWNLVTDGISEGAEKHSPHLIILKPLMT